MNALEEAREELATLRHTTIKTILLTQRFLEDAAKELENCHKEIADLLERSQGAIKENKQLEYVLRCKEDEIADLERQNDEYRGIIEQQKRIAEVQRQDIERLKETLDEVNNDRATPWHQSSDRAGEIPRRDCASNQGMAERNQVGDDGPGLSPGSHQKCGEIPSDLPRSASGGAIRHSQWPERPKCPAEVCPDAYYKVGVLVKYGSSRAEILRAETFHYVKGDGVRVLMESPVTDVSSVKMLGVPNTAQTPEALFGRVEAVGGVDIGPGLVQGVALERDARSPFVNP